MDDFKNTMLYTSNFGSVMGFAKDLDIGMDIPCIVGKEVIDGTRRFEINGIRDLPTLIKLQMIDGNTARIPGLTWATLPTGINVKVPDDSWMMITARSSTFFNRGILVAPGVIDAGFTGELLTRIYNLNQHPIEISNGDKLSQAIIIPRYANLSVVMTDSLPKTKRGNSGFGSSDGGEGETHNYIHEGV